ncbi:MAG: type I-E CRISPR-associated protein Cas5/CasD [Anaerovoracaceae bacterium]
MKTILLKFSGPLQSWGTSSHFETRHTDPYPSKSAVIGMIAAAFGYRRDDDESIRRLNQLHYAVRADQIGSVLKDFHTARKYKKNGDFERNYVTNRYYLEDSVFVVGIGNEDDDWIDSIEDALRHPYFQLFLGRRSLPVTLDFLLGSVETDVITALKDYEWQAASRYRKAHTNQVTIYADAELIDDSDDALRNDHVVSFSQIRGRQFTSRKEARLRVKVFSHEDHDAFEAIGE